MNILPKDIERKIDTLFSNEAENKEVKTAIIGLWSTNLNVGEAQLARSILTISGNDINEFRSVFKDNFYGDPRDVIMVAEEKLGNPEHYFIPPFEEIEKPQR
jgi:hypothetical protein